MPWNVSAPYELLTNSTKTSTISGVIEYADSVSNGLLGFILLFMLFGITFLSFAGLPFDRRILASLGVASVFSVFLTIMGLLGSYYAPTLIIITFLAWVLVKDK